MSNRSDRLLLEDIREAIERIAEYTAGMGESGFLADRKTVDAVVRNLEIIGEAANRLSEQTRKRRPRIRWPQIIGLRNRIVHEYFGVDAEMIWKIARQDLPELKADLFDKE